MSNFYKYKILQSYLQSNWSPGSFVPNDYFRLEIPKGDLSGNKTVTIRNRAHELHTDFNGNKMLNNENLYYALSTSAVHELKDRYENNLLTDNEKSDLSKLSWTQLRNNTLTLDSSVLVGGGDCCYIYLTSLYSDYEKIYGGNFFQESSTDIDLYIRPSIGTGNIMMGGQFESLIFGTNSSNWTSSFINDFQYEDSSNRLITAADLLIPRFTGSTLSMPYDIFNKSLHYYETYKDCKFTYSKYANLQFKDVDNEDHPSDVVMKGVFNGSNITDLTLSFPAGTNGWSISLGKEMGSFKTNTLKNITLNIDQSKISLDDPLTELHDISNHWTKVSDFGGYDSPYNPIRTFEGINKYATIRINSTYRPPTQSSDHYACGIPIPSHFDGTVIFKNTTNKYGWANSFAEDGLIYLVYSRWVDPDANPLFCLDGSNLTYPEVETVNLYLGSSKVKTYSFYYYPDDTWGDFIDRQLSMGADIVFTNSLDKRQMVIENNGYIYPIGKYYLDDGASGPSDVEFACIGTTSAYDSQYINIGSTSIRTADGKSVNHIYIGTTSNVGVRTSDKIDSTKEYKINTDQSIMSIQ